MYAVEIQPKLLSEMALDPAWLTNDEVWRNLVLDLKPDDKRYAETVREGVREGRSKAGGGLCWLFSVREGKGFLLQHK